MTVYLGTKAVLDPVKGTLINLPKWLPDGDLGVGSTYTFGTTGLPTLTNGDIIQQMTVPANIYITGMSLDVDKLDSGGSPTLVLNVGDASVNNRHIKLSTIGQAGGYAVPNINGSLLYNYTANTQLGVYITTTAAGAVPASANVRLVVNYSADP